MARAYGGDDDDGDAELHVLGCRLTYQGQTVTSAEAWFTVALRPQKPEGPLGRKAQDGHLDFHTALELWRLKGTRRRLSPDKQKRRDCHLSTTHWSLI